MEYRFDTDPVALARAHDRKVIGVIFLGLTLLLVLLALIGSLFFGTEAALWFGLTGAAFLALSFILALRRV